MQEEAVDEFLRDVVPKPPELHQTPQHKSRVQCDEFEAPVEPIGCAELGIERGTSGGGHDLAAKVFDEGSACATRAPVGKDQQIGLGRNGGAFRGALHLFEGMG